MSPVATPAMEALAALQRRPQDPGLRYAAARALFDAGQPDDARTLLLPLVAAHPDHPDLAALDGQLLEALGRPGEAVAAYQRALAARPEAAPIWNALGNLLAKLDRPTGAVQAFEAAREVVGEVPGLLVNLASAQIEAGDDEAGWALATRAVEAGGGVVARLARTRLAPIVAGEAPARARWNDRVLAALDDALHHLDDDLATPKGRADALRAAGHLFRAHYLAQPDRPRADRHGELLFRIAQAAFPGVSRHPAAGADPSPRPPHRRHRVVFASEHFREHTVVKLFATWIGDLDPERFEVRLVHLARRSDATTRRLAHLAPLQQAFGPLDNGVRALLAARPDTLVWPDLGMGSPSLLLAALGLAPRQLVGWGHPVATGLPTIDGVLSSAAMEPANGDAHYRAPLHRLPGLGVRPERPWAAPAPVGRAAFGLPVEVPLALCAQSLFKLHPEDDRVFARLLAQAPKAHLAFVRLPQAEATARFRARLDRALAAERVDPARVHLVDRQPPERWMALNRCADVFLDGRHWSGGVTTLEALAMGLVPVTRWGDRMRSRHTAGLLTELGLAHEVAPDDDAYLAQARRLLTEPATRDRLAGHIAAHLPRLYESRAPGRALAELLDRSADRD